eukprot:648070-Hanusia_phi.AAC.1
MQYGPTCSALRDAARAAHFPAFLVLFPLVVHCGSREETAIKLSIGTCRSRERQIERNLSREGKEEKWEECRIWQEDVKAGPGESCISREVYRCSCRNKHT